MSILSVDLNNINVDDVNFEDHSDTIIHARLTALHNRFILRVFKKHINKDLVPIVRL